MMVAYNLALLGPFRLERPAARGGRFESDKVRALLAFLASEPGPHRRETLATLLWPEKPEQRSRRNLSQALYNLRQVVDPADEHIAVTSRTVQFLPGKTFEVDLLRFEQYLQDVSQHPHPHSILCDGCRQRLEAAADLPRGQFLEGLHVAGSVVFEDWLRRKRELLRDKLIETLRMLVHSSERLGHYSAALTYLQRVQELDPLHEEICRQWMRLLVLSGQRNAALRRYEAFRLLLWDELGVEPEEKTQALYQRLLSMEAPEDAPPISQQLPGLLSSSDGAWDEAQTLEVAGEMARARGDYGQARTFHERALERYQAANDRRGMARSLGFLGLAARDTGDLRRARRLIRQARQIYQELGDRFSSAEMDITLARLLTFLGEFSKSADLINEALPVYGDLGLQQRLAYFTGGLALNQMMMGRYAEARANASQCMQLSYLLGDRQGVCFGMSLLGTIAVAGEDDRPAEQLLRQALVLAKTIDRPEDLGGVLSSLCYLMVKGNEFQRASVHMVDGLQLVAKSHNIIAALFIIPATAFFLKMRGEGKRAYELYALCNKFALFEQSAYFATLYAPYFEHCQTTAPRQQGASASPDLLWRAVDNLLAQVHLFA